jgi:hypothetical protein
MKCRNSACNARQRRFAGSHRHTLLAEFRQHVQSCPTNAAVIAIPQVNDMRDEGPDELLEPGL